MDRIAVLMQAYPFQDSAPEELASLLPSFKSHQFKRGEAVWVQGDPADELWFVLTGELRGVHAGEDGSEVVTGLIGPGQSFGEIGLFLSDQTRWASCIATVPSSVLSLHRDRLMEFLTRHPPALRRMLESLSRMAWMQSMAFRELAFRDVRGRVAWRLVDLARRHGEPVEAGTRIAMKVPQATLAGMVAASRENTNRALAAFAAAGYIRYDDGHIVVVDADALSSAAGAAARQPAFS